LNKPFRLTSLILSIVIILSLFFSSCGKKDDKETEVSPSPSPIITTPSPTPNLPEYEVKLIGTVVDISSFLRIRSAPNTNSEVIAQAKNGDRFVVVQQFYDGGKWHQIKYGEGVAYVHSDYLKVTEEKFEITP